MEWELIIRDFTILEAAEQGISGHAWGEWESWVWYCLEACPTMPVPSVIGKTFKCGKMKKGEFNFDYKPSKESSSIFLIIVVIFSEKYG